MAHPQNSFRGLWAKKQVNLVDASGNTTQITANSTGLVLDKGIKLSGARHITANSTGFIFTAQSAKPSTRSAAKWTIVTNSTGVNAVAVNTTGTTWKFLNVTAVIPT